MNTAALLNIDDHCMRAEFLSRTWEKGVIHPMAALYRAIEVGLESDTEDPGQATGDHLMGLAVDRGLDTPQSDQLGHATHLAAIADFVVWMLRTGDPWERPADKHGWESGAYLNQSGTRLRRVVLADRWGLERYTSEEHEWRTIGETAIYGVPMDLIVIVLGAARDGRRHSAISKGYLHPVNESLRFQRRDGEQFGPNWVRTFREASNIGREEWLEAMTADGVLSECVLTHEVPVPARSEEIRELIVRKLDLIRNRKNIPDPQFSMCHDPISPCQFESCCPYFRMPSEKMGFIRKI